METFSGKVKLFLISLNSKCDQSRSKAFSMYQGGLPQRRGQDTRLNKKCVCIKQERYTSVWTVEIWEI